MIDVDVHAADVGPKGKSGACSAPSRAPVSDLNVRSAAIPGTLDRDPPVICAGRRSLGVRPIEGDPLARHASADRRSTRCPDSPHTLRAYIIVRAHRFAHILACRL